MIPEVDMSPRTCAKCGENPAGPGRVLCTECKTAIEQRSRAHAITDTLAADLQASIARGVPPNPPTEDGSLFL